MLILRTGIRILFLLIIAICCQITTKNNTSLYLQPVYAQPDGSRNNSPSTSANDGRAGLLAAIRAGVTLKSVKKNNKKKEPHTGKDVASILARRMAMEQSDSESDSNSDNHVVDDQEWDDNTEPAGRQDDVSHNPDSSSNSTHTESLRSPSPPQPPSAPGVRDANDGIRPPPPPPPLPSFAPVLRDGNAGTSSGAPVLTVLPPSSSSVKAGTSSKSQKQKKIRRKKNSIPSTKPAKGSNSSAVSTGDAVSTDNTEPLVNTHKPPHSQDQTSNNDTFPPAPLDLDISNAHHGSTGETPKPTSGSQVSNDQRNELPPPPLENNQVIQLEDGENYDNTLPPPPTQEELEQLNAPHDSAQDMYESTPDSQASDAETDQQGKVPPPPFKKDQATQTEDDENYSLTKPDSFSELQKSVVNDHTNASQYHDTNRAIIHYTSIPMKVVNNFISRKIVDTSSSSHIRYIGASESNSILQKKYELECKYIYNATTIPQKNVLGKVSIMGTIINLKYQFSSKLTAGMFYAPTITTYTTNNQSNNNAIAAATKDTIINHCIGMYTSYAITPATYLSNQVSVGFSITNDNNKDKNSSEKYGYPHYFTVDSFVNHKTKIDATKTISPFLGLSYYSTNPRLHHNIGDINNLSLVIGVKFQYEYKYKDLVFAPWLKLTHTRSLYSNISAKMQNKSITGQGEHLIDLLRDFHVAFNPSSSVTLALTMRRRDLRFAAGYEYSIHHECDNSYSHTFFARINITF